MHKLIYNKIKKKYKSEFPYLVDIKITNKCNNNCVYCYQDSTIMGKECDFETLQNIATSLKKVGTFEIVLGGGDVLTHPELINIIKLFTNKLIKVGITIKYKQNLIIPEEIIKNVNTIAISIDDHDCLNYKTIQWCKQFISEWKNKNIFNSMCKGVYFQFILELSNLKNITYFIKEMQEKTTNMINVNLLGFKQFGRGEKCEVDLRYNENWIAESKLWLAYGCNTGIDSVISSKYKNKLIEYGVNKNQLVCEEGKSTCYIDAVEKYVAPSSFTEKKHVKFSELDSKNFLQIFSKF